MNRGERNKIAVVLLYMGGPDTLSAIRPFLFNLLRDRDIVRIPGGIVLQTLFAYIVSGIRTRKVRPFYETIGGGSPLNQITLKQAVLLEKYLNEEGEDFFSVHVGMRYWYPFTRDAVFEALERSPSRIVALPFYPHYSRTTTGSSFRELSRCLKREQSSLPVIMVKDFHDHPGYVASIREKITAAISGLRTDKTAVIFSAHGLPKKIIDEGDPYLAQVEKTVKLVMEGFPGLSHYLSFQSRVGRDWLEPATEDTIRLARESWFDNVVMVPISFVSDHIETLYEIDVLFKDIAEEIGLNFIRTESLNESELFINALGDVVLSHLIDEVRGV
ncbi:MAG: ferrochelatase [Deltaproteobacteria bacterium]|nr:ferrochelatase [Deltaproteobacteria bacterium]